MKKALFISIFTLLVVSPLPCALAQTASSTPDPTVKKPSEGASSTTDDRKSQDPAPGAAVENPAAKNQTGPLKTTDLAKAASSVPADLAAEAQKNYNAGVALFESDKLEEAIVALKQANKLRPNDPQTQYMLGMVYMKTKAYMEATESFKRAVRLKPDWPEAQFKLGVMFYVLGKKTQANEAYAKLRELNSPLAITLYRINSTDESVKTEPARPTTKQVEAVSVSAPAATPSNVNQSPAIGDSRNTSTTPSSSSEATAPLTRAPSGDSGLSKAVTTGSSEATAPATRTVNGDPASSNKAVATGSPEATATATVTRIVNADPALSSKAVATGSPEATAPVTGTAVADTAVNNKTVARDDSLLTEIYKVGVGDVLDIRVLNSTSNRSTLYSVMDSGVIDFPLGGGAISVAGLATKEIQARITSELKRLAVQEGAQVTVGVRQYASHVVIVTGLVSSPGTKFLRREAVPLYVLLAEVQPRLDAGRVVIMRAGSTGQVVDLNDSAALQFIVRPGDVINVMARQQDFYYIAGRISYPGQKVFQPGITLVQAILAAGGLARDNEVELSREGADGHLSTTKFNLKEIKLGIIQDPKLQPGDRIEVFHKGPFRF